MVNDVAFAQCERAFLTHDFKCYPRNLTWTNFWEEIGVVLHMQVKLIIKRWTMPFNEILIEKEKSI